VVLVAAAPHTGKVVGLMALTAALDVRALQQNFDLSAYDNLEEVGAPHPNPNPYPNPNTYDTSRETLARK